MTSAVSAGPQGIGYDISAVERISGKSSLAPRLYLPLARR
jgi:hypothetical protein